MNEESIKKYAADVAKEVTVAKATNTTITFSSECGKSVADFYNEIYKGVLKTLTSSFLNNDN